jgi:hypothetical protein
MPLNKAQLMATPGGPGVIGAVKAGTGIAVATDGTISLDPTQVVSQILPGANITLQPASGIGAVTINALASGSGDFPSGTATLFIQASAPAGWTQVNTQNNKAIRVVTGAGGGTGGSLPFTSVFTSVPVTGSVSFSGLSVSGGSTNQVNQTPTGSVSLSGLSVGSTSLSTGQIPAHTHTYRIRDNSDNNKGGQCCVAPPTNAETTATGGNGSHTHSVGGSGSFSGNNMSHSHSVSASVSGNGSFSGNSLNLSVQYVDAILCSKS